MSRKRNRSGSKARRAERAAAAAATASLPGFPPAAPSAPTVPDASAPRTDVRGDWSPAPPSSAPTPTPREDAARPSITADKRRLDRISQRELGKVDFRLRPPGKDWLKVRLWDFSSIGFGVLLESGDAGEEPILSHRQAEGSRPSAPVAPGDEVRIRVAVQAHASFEAWCVVMNVAPWQGAVKIGLRRLDVGMPQAVGQDRRASERLPLSPALGLAARVRNPFLYGHWSALRVTDVSRDLGFAFASEDPSILLFEGMELSIHFDLASYRNMPILARVTWVFATRASEVRFGVECLSMDWRLQGGICDYLLFSGQWSPGRLKEAGFRGHRVKGHLRFRTVRTMEEYAEVLRLRRDAYVSKGKRPESTQPEDMATPLDGISRILMASHHGRLVGSMTFTFPPSEETLLDSQSGFPGWKYPVALPPKANMIEVSRLCIREDYRGTDLLQGLFEHGLKHFLMSDRHWLITSATEDLAPMYQRIGFVRLKAAYKHPLLNNREHHLLIAHRSAFLFGLGIGLLTWNSVFGDLVAHLLRRKLIAAPGWMRAVIRVKLWFRPLAARLVDGKAKAGFRKHLESLRASRRKGGADLAGRESGGPPSDPSSLYAGLELDAPQPGADPEKKMGT